MSECKWTPGNLIVSWNGYYYDIHAVDEDGRYVDQFCMGAAKDQEANANLISASKDMYEALDCIIALVDHCKRVHLACPITSQQYLSAKAALKKARGETK